MSRYLKLSPDQTSFAEGAGVCLANTDFLCQFGGMQSFRQIPLGDREQFYAKLSESELSLRSRELGRALGIGLYLIWLTEVLAGRRDATELLGEQRTKLNREASRVRLPADREQVSERPDLTSPGNIVRCIPAPCAGW
jgi:hypothetical protein